MEDYNKKTILTKIINFFNKYIIHILVGLIILFLVILLIPKQDIKSKAISKLEKYLKNNNIILTSNEKEFTFRQIGFELDDDCYESGIIVASTNEYKVYYVCNDELSEDLKMLIKKNNLPLYGDNPTYVKAGLEYDDPGYYNKNGLSVSKIGNVEKNLGMYLLKYKTISNNQILSSTRVVILTNKKFKSSPSITLNGEKIMNIVLGEKFTEPGYRAYDALDGDLTYKVKSDYYAINTNIIGRNLITYRVTNSQGKVGEVSRVVNVITNEAKNSELTIKTSLEPQTLTKDQVTIKLEVDTNNVVVIGDPSGRSINSNMITYKVADNGEYQFFIRLKDGSILEKTVEVSNIDNVAPTGSCTTTLTNDKTEVVVEASDASGIKKYNYLLDSISYESTNNTFSIDRTVLSSNVIVYDNVLNSVTLNCKIVDNRNAVVPSNPTNNPTNGNPSTVVKDKNFITSRYNGMGYYLYYPDDLNLNIKNPLVIFLHGSNECGIAISSLNVTEFVKMMKNGQFKNAIYLTPQCNCNNYWDNCLDTLKQLIDYIVRTYNVNSKKISITGHSLGAIGVYSMIQKNPYFFSAGVVVAGRNKSEKVTGLLNTPIRHYHGTSDTKVKYERGLKSAEAIKNAGGQIEFIPLKGKGHGITDYVYKETDAIDWMIKQSR